VSLFERSLRAGRTSNNGVSTPSTLYQNRLRSDLGIDKRDRSQKCRRVSAAFHGLPMTMENRKHNPQDKEDEVHKNWRRKGMPRFLLSHLFSTGMTYLCLLFSSHLSSLSSIPSHHWSIDLRTNIG